MEDISSAIVKIQELIDNLPLKAYRVSQYLHDIAEAVGVSLDEPPLMDRGIIISKIWQGLKSINDSLEAEYSQDTDETIGRRSTIYPRLLEFSTRLKVYQEAIISNEIFQSMEKRFKRIDSILPTIHYDFRSEVAEIQKSLLDPEIVSDIGRAVQKFEKDEFDDVIYKCGKVNEAIALKFKQHLINTFEIPLSQTKVSPLIDEIKARLENNVDKNGLSLGVKKRLEWFLWSLIQTVHFLRNIAMHSREGNNDLPEWMKIYRNLIYKKVEYARLALVCTIRAARELQELIRNS